MTGENDVLRYLIKRLAAHQDTACKLDYPRIEELCHLILTAMKPNSFNAPEKPVLVNVLADPMFQSHG